MKTVMLSDIRCLLSFWEASCGVRALCQKLLFQFIRNTKYIRVCQGRNSDSIRITTSVHTATLYAYKLTQKYNMYTHRHSICVQTNTEVQHVYTPPKICVQNNTELQHVDTPPQYIRTN